MSKLLLTIVLVLLNTALQACPVCEKQQPKLLRGITHGAGPESNWDYVIILITAGIALASLYFSAKWLCKPGEAEKNHIKHTVLNLQ
jgi:hypothetical protein